ncbi:MAG: phosphoribosylaminoimidazolesuccinocarboxamide synthase [Rhodospirillaceae bacterium TMED8]|nr:phosphoribosylaminoimidazolesuccinocarboxamide synthase [Magnetovibrio sp.]OUT49897.1 MAG: phosphoribosylaminoimidazolesuccinocarboxamide synthase [Rhodospirillaceae bacterium TMED8]|tara:strand:+ start:1425 stop:2405 length:981 start_codon:yes stop_codon:yes gene_type:complete
MINTKTAISNCLTDAIFDELPGHFTGKVRESYNLRDGRRVMIATDRQSAFDYVLAAVPHKGQVLNQTATFWFEKTSDICANHLLEIPDPNVVIVKNLNMLPLEMVVRAYMTGSTETSIWQMYNRGNREMYGLNFPDGMVKNQKLTKTILTPTTKGDAGNHDTPITPTEIIKREILTPAQWDELVELSLALFARGQDIAKANGLILVDTKYEFGLDTNGRFTLADEIHTPDSSRYWIADTYERNLKARANPDSLDKEFLRLWITSRCDPYNEPIPDIPDDTIMTFAHKYIQLYERVTGEQFLRAPMDRPVKERIRENLAKTLTEYFF